MENKIISKETKATGLLLASAFFWGTCYVATQMAVNSGLTSTFIMFLRFFIASGILFCLFPKRLRKFTAQELKYGAVAGAMLFLGFFAQTAGLRYSTPSNNAFITCTNVIIVPFVTWIVFKQGRPKVRLFAAAFICFAGVALLNFSFKEGLIFKPGDIYSLLCALIFACHISYLSISVKKVDVIKLTYLQVILSAVLSLVVFLLLDIKSFSMENLKDGFWAVAYLGSFGTCLSFIAQTFAQKYASSTKAAILMSSEALFGSLLSVILGYELFTLNMLVSGILFIGSVVILEVNISDHVKGKKSITN